MPPIGETLREARLRQKIDIADVEHATKIRGKYLRALEGEEFDRLPGTTFVRTFIRTYAEYLGLDPQLLVEEYRARHEESEETDLQPFAPQPSARPRAREPRRRAVTGGGEGPSRTMVIAGVALAVLVALVVIGLVVGEDPQQSGVDGSPASGEERQGGGNGGSGGAREEREPETVELRITPDVETYVCVENGEGDELINANITETETVEGEVLRLNLGNTLGVQLEANGEEVSVEESPNPVGLELTPGDQDPIPEGERPCQ
jgi:cytoskeleton protein RodZ